MFYHGRSTWKHWSVGERSAVEAGANDVTSVRRIAPGNVPTPRSAIVFGGSGGRPAASLTLIINPASRSEGDVSDGQSAWRPDAASLQPTAAPANTNIHAGPTVTRPTTRVWASSEGRQANVVDDIIAKVSTMLAMSDGDGSGGGVADCEIVEDAAADDVEEENDEVDAEEPWPTTKSQKKTPARKPAPKGLEGEGQRRGWRERQGKDNMDVVLWPLKTVHISGAGGGVERECSVCKWVDKEHSTSPFDRRPSQAAGMDIVICCRGVVLNRTVVFYEYQHRRGNAHGRAMEFDHHVNHKDFRYYEADANAVTCLAVVVGFGFSRRALRKVIMHITRVGTAVPTRFIGGVDVLAEMMRMIITNFGMEFRDRMHHPVTYTVVLHVPFEQRDDLHGDIDILREGML
ncbi:hypothetical protein CBR_g72670 [Chara braunii]|uniref:Uncharacterized protein n=1 Tax=Chara braunii TaxID=69332 RepID=A0A388KA30_CHABU|nr:hypothetical protein CBR_g72670 [Chara braunii]|eukprot:GBG66915.1 hypothetical protein CBR_g72670 [Chara braunii]